MILKVSSLLENGKDVTSFLGTVNDSSCSLAVADVHDLNILRRKFFCKALVKLSLGSHSETYETVFKWNLIRLAVTFYKEGRILNLKESSFCKLMYIVFFHHGLCVVLAYRIKVTSDLIHHLNDRDVCISVCEEFHNIKTYSTAAYDNDFFAFQIGEVLYIIFCPSQ